MPSVAVVVPAHNAAATIAATLERVASQLRDGDHVIVVDDGSSDDTQAAVRTAAPSATILRRPAPGGPAAARNLGAKEADADLLVFVDADDLPAPGWLDALVAATPNGGAATGALDPLLLNAPSSVHARALPTAGDDQLGRYLGVVPLLRSGNMAIDRVAFLEVGGFNELRKTGEDLDLSIRLHAARVPVAWAPDAVIAYRLRSRPIDIIRQGWTYGVGQVALSRAAQKQLGLRGSRIDILAWRRLARQVLRSIGGTNEWLRFLWLAAIRGGRVAGSVSERHLHL